MRPFHPWLHLFFIACASTIVLSQSNTARVVGMVRDPSGAVLPGVSVQAVNLDNNLSRSVTTNDVGNYVITNLPVGRYKIAVELQGFKRVEQGPLELLVNQTARIDLSMELGETSEVVNVDASTPLLESATSTLGNVIDQVQVSQIPLNGRNFIQLGQLVPGATPGPPAATTVRTRQGGVSLTMNGQRQDQNNWQLDGVDNNAQTFGMVVIVPSVESVREFKVQTSNYSAEFGNSAGAIVNIETKSGSNAFHGSMYEFLRNKVFDAAEFFAQRNPSTGEKIKAPLTFNQFGGSLGGYLLPDKTFFFFNYEGKRVRRGVTLGSPVPTLAERQGDFRGSATLYDPLTYDPMTGLRQPFQNNIIPQNRIYPASLKILDFIPKPNNPDPVNNYVRLSPNIDDFDQFTVRADHHISARQWIMGRFSYYNTENLTGNTFPLDADILQNRHRSAVLQHTYTFTPNLVNEFRFGGTRYHFIFLDETAGKDFTSQFGLPTANPGTLFDGFPDLRITGFARLGGNAVIPLDRVENTFDLSDHVNWFRGRHSLKIGGGTREYYQNEYGPPYLRGRYYFNGAFTAQAGSIYKNGFADFLLGYPSEQRLANTTGLDAARPRNFRFSLYIQDDWKVRPSLTVNLGFRYESEGPWTDAKNRLAAFDSSTGQVVYAKDLKFALPIPFPYRYLDTNEFSERTRGWSPRLGLAWSITGSTVVRGGYGVFWSVATKEDLNNSALIPPLLLADIRTSGTTVPEIVFGKTATGTDPSSLVPKVPSFATLAYGGRLNPYTQQWNLTLEHQLGKNTMVSMGYVGNHTVHLMGYYEGNPALPPAAGAIQARRKFPGFGGITLQTGFASSRYNALQVSAQRRFDTGLGFLAAYTWSKSMDNYGGEAESTGAGIQNPDNRNAAWGLSGFDLRHRFTFSPVYQLPFGRGRRFLSNAHPIAISLLGGWQVTGIVTLQTGFPFTPTVGADLPNAAAGTVHPDLVGDNHGNLESGRSIDRWFNTAAFRNPAAFNFGNAGRNILIGPGFTKVDLGVMKEFRIFKEHTLQFRAEFFNAFNHPNFQFPGTTVGTSNFGVIRTAYEPRIIQFALRYSF